MRYECIVGLLLLLGVILHIYMVRTIESKARKVLLVLDYALVVLLSASLLAKALIG
jgi:uncharacterized membrane protein YecN with MAPEG domain